MDNIKSIGIAIVLVVMWISLFYMLNDIIYTHAILAWVLIIAILITRDVWM